MLGGGVVLFLVTCISNLHLRKHRSALCNTDASKAILYIESSQDWFPLCPSDKYYYESRVSDNSFCTMCLDSYLSGGTITKSKLIKRK